MATIKTIIPAHLDLTTADAPGLLDKYLNFTDGQAGNRTLWFFISLIVHGALFLPVPIFLIGYFNAPVLVLAITMISFFTNLIANMGGSGIRTTISCFIASVVIHLAMVFACTML